MIKINLAVTDEVDQKISKIADDECKSKTAILREAVSIYTFLYEQVSKGRGVALVDKDGAVICEVVLVGIT